MIFIELSTNEGKFIGNINLIKRIFVTKEGKTAIFGLNNIGHIEINESYEEVISKINARLSKVNRLN